MKITPLRSYGPLGVITDIDAVYPSKISYTKRQLKKIAKGKNEDRDLFYMPLEQYTPALCCSPECLDIYVDQCEQDEIEEARELRYATEESEEFARSVINKR